MSSPQSIAALLRERRASYPNPLPTDSEGWRVIPEFSRYEVNHFSVIRNRKRKHIISTHGREHAALKSDSGKRISRGIYYFSMKTFFEGLVKQYPTIDHLSEDYHNNHICNLVYCTQAENTRKSTELRPRSSGAKLSKEVEQWSADGKTLVATHSSIRSASKAVGGTPYDVMQCIRGRRDIVFGSKWRFRQFPDLPGEEWRSAKHNAKVFYYMHMIGKTYLQVSNLGRIRTKTGIVTLGSSTYASRPYSLFSHKGVHIFVMLYFGENDPLYSRWYAQLLDSKQRRTLFVLHDDSIERDSKGYYSNARAHLRLGDQKENMQESTAIGSHARINATKKRSREEKINRIKKLDKTGCVIQRDRVTGQVIGIHISCGYAARAIGQMRGESIRMCCNGVMDSAHGFCWSWECMDNVSEQPPSKKQKVNSMY